MEVNEIVTIISTLGFPICCCGALFWLIVKVLKELTTALNTNTAAITRLFDKIDE